MTGKCWQKELDCPCNEDKKHRNLDGFCVCARAFALCASRDHLKIDPLPGTLILPLLLLATPFDVLHCKYTCTLFTAG